MPFPLSESELAKTEAKIGARFPASFRSAMLAENGGTIVTDEDDWEQYPFFDTSDRKRLSRTSNDILRETEQARQWPGFPADGWAIASNGCGDHLYFKRSPADPARFEATVYAYWHETGESSVLAGDFAELAKE